MQKQRSDLDYTCRSDDFFCDISAATGQQILQSKNQSMWSAFRSATIACDRKEETLMKTDLVLTTREYLDMCFGVPKHVNPPAKDARHIPITAEGDAEANYEVHGCPVRSLGVSMSRLYQPETRSARTSSGFCKQRTKVNKMEYLIVIGVVAMMALYVVIIAGCLEQPEW